MKNDTQIAYPIIKDLSDVQLQASNDCFIRFFRFNLRDTRDKDPQTHQPLFLSKDVGLTGGIRHSVAFENNKNSGPVTDASILDVASDIIACSISKTKGSPTGSFEVVLSPGDINYHHVLHPGDHFMVWMKRNRVEEIDKGTIKSRTYNNSFDSGLKMYGVITDVRRIFVTSSSGVKTLRYRISGKDVGSFFESQVYYTAWLSDLLNKYGVMLNTIFDSKTVQFIQSLTGVGTVMNQRVEDIISILVAIYLGLGPGENYTQTPDVLKKLGVAERPLSPNLPMLLPNNVGSVFYRDGAMTIAELLYLRIGVENYTKSLRPTRKPMEGWKILTVEAGNQQSIWSILQSYANLAINEMFIDLKPQIRKVEFDTSGNVTSDTGSGYRLYPTLVCRQIPFTSSAAKNAFNKLSTNDGILDENLALESTTFLELPRIKIPEKFIIQEDIGRGTHERFNFIEIYGVNIGLTIQSPGSQQVAGNFAMDSASIKRYGLKTLISKTDYQFPTPDDTTAPDLLLISKWIYLLADWWLGAHTLESGTFVFAGIEELISLGDNIEIIREQGVNELYHIEAYQHNYTVESGSGVGTFRTSVQVTRGQRIDEFPIYASGQFDEESELDIGFSDTEFEGTARPTNSATSHEVATSPTESPANRKKVNK